MKRFLFFVFFFLLSKQQALAQTGIPLPEGTGLPDTNLMDVIINFANWLLTIFMILAVLAFIVTGLMYLFALGNERSGALDSAKNNFKYAVIALFTVGSAYVIITTINYLLGGTL
ncbi:MAG: hypothetical protein ACOCUF_03385 [Patescibacteria group bacterium]